MYPNNLNVSIGDECVYNYQFKLLNIVSLNSSELVIFPSLLTAHVLVMMLHVHKNEGYDSYTDSDTLHYQSTLSHN